MANSHSATPPGSLLDRLDSLSHRLSLRPLTTDEHEEAVALVFEVRKVLTDTQTLVVDYAEGRLDSLVALGKIGLRLLEATG